jgi:hypothetical protein
MSEITTPQPEKDLTRVDTMGSSTDSRTASSALPAASVRQEVPHSPLPWSCGPDTENCGGGMNIVRPDGYRVAHTARVVAGEEYVSEAEAKANAEYLVLTANVYPALIAERDALRDQIAQLREALTVTAEWLDTRNPTETFERIAGQFYRETGFMRPGKDEPMSGYTSEEHRRRREVAWSAWVVARRTAMLAQIHAALLSSCPATGEGR